MSATHVHILASVCFCFRGVRSERARDCTYACIVGRLNSDAYGGDDNNDGRQTLTAFGSEKKGTTSAKINDPHDNVGINT